mmetsp:Transcript_3406/g.14320  ORF Transcript_3406/g.14320 Transcript_3406/m.14320 type:complete len:300 (+) Transcript_3406:1116-2015(+)
MTPSRRRRDGDGLGALSGGSRLFVGSGSTPKPCSPANDAKLNPPLLPSFFASPAAVAASAAGESPAFSWCVAAGSGARSALFDRPSCGSSAPPEASAARARAASSALRPARSERGRLRASVPRNVPGASKTRSVFSSAPLTNAVDPPATVFASVFSFAFLSLSIPLPLPWGGSAATHRTACPWICGRAISRHPAVGVSSDTATAFRTSRRARSWSSSTRLSQLAWRRVVRSAEPESRKRPAWSQERHETSPAWPAEAGAGTQREISPSPPPPPERRHACSAPPCACAKTRRAVLSKTAP